MVGDYTIALDGLEVVDGSEYEFTVNDTIELAVNFAGKPIATAPVVEITAGSEYASLNGTVITANVVSNQEKVTVKVSFGELVVNFSFIILPEYVVEDYETELLFSAIDGLFFDADFNLVTVDDIFDSDVTISRALDAEGNRLTVENDAILGIDLGANDTWKATNVTLYSATEAYKINVKAADLIIDEARDFEYFSLKQTAGVAGGGNTAYIAPGEMEFDGYYILAKDINFEQEGYAHDFYNGQVVAWGARGYDKAAEYIGTTHGLTGTFDGNGHSITDITFDNTATSGDSFEGGLFGWHNGGTIKNTAFISPDEGDLKGGAIFGWAIKGSALFQDCYFYFDTSYGNYGTYQFVCSSLNLATFTRCYIELKDTNITYNARGGFIEAKPNFEDSYFVFSHSAFLGGYGSYTAKASEDTAVVDIGTRKRVIADAAFVDGVANVATCDRFYPVTRWDSGYYSLKDYTITTGTTVYEKGSTYDITLLDGLQRYTSKAKMATVENDWTDWDPAIWTIVNGAPVFTSRLA